jgi:hypothetical protein
MSPPAVPHAPAALHPAAPADYSLVPPSRPRVGGLVWGVIVTVVGLAVTLIGFRRTTVDLDVLAIVALFAVGVILLTGALIAAVRGRAKPAVPPTYPHPR